MRRIWLEETNHFLDEPCKLGQRHTGYCVYGWSYMPTYGYKADDGTYTERQYSMDDIVPVEIVEDDKVYKRVYTFRGFVIK